MGCAASGNSDKTLDGTIIQINVIEATTICTPSDSFAGTADIERRNSNSSYTSIRSIIGDSEKFATPNQNMKPAATADTCEVTISYHDTDSKVAKKLSEKLTENGLKVWHNSSAGSNATSSEIASAILKCKVFIQILSDASAGSKVCQDELSLAYISNKQIFPVGVEQFSVVTEQLDSGRKLMLAKINWTFLITDEDWTKNVPAMIEKIKENIQSLDDEEISEDSEFDELNFTMNKTRKLPEGDNIPDRQNEMDFWDRHFSGSETASYFDFRENFLKDYGSQIKETFGHERPNWLLVLIYKDIFEQVKNVTKKKYVHFCGTSSNPHIFYKRVEEYAVCMHAMKEVFDMNSSVRLTAVQNMAAFKTRAVMAILLDQLSDSDPNMRAVSALALGKANQHNKQIIRRLLARMEDDDRLVRESVCLALGHLKVAEAVEPLLDRWRNDPISTVRGAAQLALEKMPGPEAQAAIKVTQVLTDEMTNLRKLRKK
ncbi:uncharacterized protein LOC141900191 [Tubulanus polymorphus]|uniref:uncharacterized protein LOC141900191 n=1 Tax=Tubulanus polymorphus TaxID=672921 RepID=UPI003DA5BA65